ncbi:MAG: hypothetical protein J6K78_01095 [Tidjanibacter sp.]|nr:hypothetical protein [Tidjanibacter sp.]
MKEFKEIDNIGKRLPYTTPEGFFEGQRATIMARVADRTHKSHTLRRGTVALWAAAVAASVVIAAVVATIPDRTPSFDQMLAQLTDEQCNSLVASYTHDVFLADFE